MGKIKDYQIFKCPYCSCEYYDSSARDGKKVGDPMIECPQCGKKLYRHTVLEPALISGKRYFNIRYSSFYGNFRIVLILIYAVFLFFILVKRDFIMGICLVGISVALYAVYELIRIFHRNSFIKSDYYNNEISLSLKRLSDIPYAKMVIEKQGIEETSVYYYELMQSKNE